MEITEINDELNLIDLKKEAKEKEEEQVPKEIETETLSPSFSLKTYSIISQSMVLFNKKFFKIPLTNICDDIKLLDKNMEPINFEIRTLVIDPYEVVIKTYFNENNLSILTGKLNEMLKVIYPKYEHYINWSTQNNIYITCLDTQEPAFLKCKEINITKKLMKNNKLEKEILLF